MYNNVPPQLWMQLDSKVKDHLVSVFSIPRTGLREIRDQDVVQDGYSLEDLKAITLEKMTAFIGSEETFPRAWEITCSKAKSDVYPMMNMPTAIVDEVEKEVITEVIEKTHVNKKSK